MDIPEVSPAAERSSPRRHPGYADTEHAVRASSFGTAAAAYAEHRPDYPIAAIEWALRPVAEIAGTGRPARILDLGAGTGKLTAQLAGLTIAGQPADVLAVEPDPQMLAELRGRVPGATALAGSAEAIPVPDGSVHAVLAGQAAHWFDLDLAMPEIARVLLPGGAVAGLWNGDDDRIDWVAGLHQALGRRSEVVLSSWTERSGGGFSEWLSATSGTGSAAFGPPELAGFGHRQRRTAASLIETLRTHSIFLTADPAEREEVLDRVRHYLAVTPQTASGEFSLPLFTHVVRAIRR